MNLKETYNRIAEEWHKDHQRDDWWIEGTDTFISLLPSGAHVLDVGCSGGFKSRYLIERGFRVTGVDFSENFIAIARHEVSGADFHVMDMRRVGELPGQFDAVFSQASLLHIPKKETRSVIEGFVSKLKQKGLLYIAVKGVRPGKPEEEIKEENDYGYPYRRFFSYFSLTELGEHCVALGLTVAHENVRTVGSTDWIQIVAKKI